jgi:hypothetical protein
VRSIQPARAARFAGVNELEACAGSEQGKWNRKTRRTRKWIPARTGNFTPRLEIKRIVLAL